MSKQGGGQQVMSLVRSAGIEVEGVQRGLDHGGTQSL